MRRAESEPAPTSPVETLSDFCRYACDRCGVWFDATASFQMPEVCTPSENGLPIGWTDQQGQYLGALPDHQTRCGGVIRRQSGHRT
jgi:hypothetical protein